MPSTDRATMVTPDNFARAETDMYLRHFVSRGSLGTLVHLRELQLEHTGVRPNRDTLYTEAVFDLDAGPVNITLPDTGDRFIQLITIDQDHYVVEMGYDPRAYTFTRKRVGTRYLFAAVRIFVDPRDPDDLTAAHAAQDAINVHQPDGSGVLALPTWDPVSQTKVRDALISLGETLSDLRGGGGRRDQVDPVRHLIATATGWGLNPDEDALYLSITPPDNDGSGTFRLHIHDVPVDTFWSVTVYDADGHFVRNERDAYSYNSVTAAREADDSIIIQFGSCPSDTRDNCLPIFPGWNYMVRLYRPQPTILRGEWTFPELERVD